MKVTRQTIGLYLLPTFLLVALINLWPIYYTINLSFTNKDLFNHYEDYSYIGLANYQSVIGNLQSDFIRVLLLTFLYVIICVSLFLLTGMATALALNNPRIRGLAFWRLAIILPWTIPSVISALVWKFFFNYDFGVINVFLHTLFGDRANVHWLSDPIPAFMAVVIVNLWLSYPFFTIVILGALQSIPSDLNEAASVDGATYWQRLTHIILPLLRPAITPATILSAITTFQMFNTVYLITEGGPVDVPGKPGATTFVLVYVYRQVLGKSFPNVKYGLTAATAVVIFAILFLMTIAALRASNLSGEVKR